MAERAEQYGLKVTTNVGGYGVVGVLENGPGKVLLLRSDMDGLPVVRADRAAVRIESAREMRTAQTVGVMHACGHDVHMTNLCGVARYLASTAMTGRAPLCLCFSRRRKRAPARRR